MIAWLQAKAAKWIALAATIVTALAAAAAYAFHRGAKSQANTDAAQQAAEQVAAAQNAQHTYTDANEAAAQVQQAATQQPPPNVTDRNDLDNTF